MLKTLLLILVANIAIFGHEQWVHQYLTNQGYQYFKHQNGLTISELENNLGSLAYPGTGTSWTHGTVIAGSWLEDDEDVVYYYGIHVTSFFLKSITHFWDADRGDFDTNEFYDGGTDANTLVPGGPFPNAYDKILRYSNGTVLKFPNGLLVDKPSSEGEKVKLYDVDEPGKVSYEFDNLVQFYLDGMITIKCQAVGIDVDTNEKTKYTYNSQFIVDEVYKNRIVFEILGRMAHLVQDMSVPAHAHVDAHGIDPGDQYERWVSENDSYKYWNYENIGNERLYDVTNYTNPLHFIMYTTQQIADHFGSSGPWDDGVGNDEIGGDIYPEEADYLSCIDLSSLGSPTYQSVSGFSTAQLENIRNKTLPQAIIATAALFDWFAKETGLISEVTFKNSFNAGTLEFNQETIQSSASRLLASGAIHVLTALPQVHDDYDYVWNVNEPIAKSFWSKTDGFGQSVNIINNSNISYNLNVTTEDKDATYVAGLKKNYRINRNDDCSEFDNVINNPLVSRVVEENSGTLSANLTRDVGSRIYKFAYWLDDFSASNSRIITPIDNTTYTAIYKYPTHSNMSSAFSNNSQRKTIRTPEGVMHMVYESMGKVWYERSTDEGVTWELVGALNQGRSAKNPSIDFILDNPSHVSDGYIIVSIIYDGEVGDGTNWTGYIENYFSIANSSGVFGSYLTYGPDVIRDENYNPVFFSETHNSNPVVALGVQDKIMAIWLNAQGQLLCGYGTVNLMSSTISWNTGYPKEMDWLADFPIEDNFSLVSTKDYDVNDLSVFYSAVEIKTPTPPNSIISVCKHEYMDFSDASDLYFLEPKDVNTNPSISLISQTNGTEIRKIPLVTWMAKDVNANFIGYAKVIDSENTTPYISFGNNVTSIQTTSPYKGINQIYPYSGDGEALVVWSESNNSYLHYKKYQNNTFNESGYLSVGGNSFSLSSGGENLSQIIPYVLKTNSLPYEITKSEMICGIPSVITSNYTVSSGNYVCNSNITVNSGVTLTIAAGTNITFQNGSALIVNGTLNVNGTSNNKVILNFQYPQNNPSQGIKNEIKVNSSGHANITHAEIRNAYTGIYINQGSANINNCLIRNGYSGIYLYNTNNSSNDTYITNTRIYEQNIGIEMYYSTAHLSNNEIDHNWMGINCSYYSSPYLAPDDYTSQSLGYNNIYQNSFGLYAYASSNPWLGRVGCISFGGNNTIDNNSYKDIYLYSNCSVYAENNWWGGGPPSTTYVGTGCFFDPYPFLYSAPNGAQQQSAIKITPEEEEFNNKFTPQVTSSANATEPINILVADNGKVNYDKKWSIEWKLLYAR
ncbi:MAG: hypothetical protein COW71_09650, partial [Ignavibacteriales bacterium CG18_big_fil_WC_8_21_14_2_50_31_20]